VLRVGLRGCPIYEYSILVYFTLKDTIQNTNTRICSLRSLVRQTVSLCLFVIRRLGRSSDTPIFLKIYVDGEAFSPPLYMKHNHVYNE